MATQRLNIVNGPSKFDLMLALFDGAYVNQRKIWFTVLDNSLSRTTLSITLNSVAKEDGSGESWLFDGCLYTTDYGSRPVTGYFSTKNRKGWIEIS